MKHWNVEIQRGLQNGPMPAQSFDFHTLETRSATSDQAKASLLGLMLATVAKPG